MVTVPKDGRQSLKLRLDLDPLQYSGPVALKGDGPGALWYFGPYFGHETSYHFDSEGMNKLDSGALRWVAPVETG